VITRGGIYNQSSPFRSAEHAETYLQAVFGFIGMTDVEFIIAEGIRVSPEQREAALAAARAATEAVHLNPAAA